MERSRSGKGLAAQQLQELPSLTDKDDLLGRALMEMLSRGAALVAEIHRLGDRVPKAALASGQEFLFSFDEYFKDPERNEAKLNRNAALVELDEEFQKAHGEYLERFYNVCAGIAKLAADFNRTTKDLRRGYFLSHSLEQVLLDPDGKQWIPECMHLVGATFLLLNEHFPGRVRERLVVALYRIKGEAALRDFNQVVGLVRDVEIPSHVPRGSVSISELLIARLNIDGRLARTIVSRLQSDDIYGHIRAWPLSEHRSTALASQASLLFIALLFAEAGLKAKKSPSDILPLSMGRAEMREIIDKHFTDHWCVVVTIGYVVDLEQEWSPFPAARNALADVVARLPQLRQFNKTQAKRVQALLDEYLTRGVLTERYVTDHCDSLLEVLREANATLRWRLLHSQTKAWGSSTSSVNNKEALSPAETIRLLLTTAQLEHVLREAVRNVLNSKDSTWKSCRERVSERMKELAQYFSGQVPLAKVQKDEELMKWFNGLAEEVLHLEYKKTPTASGRRVQSLIKALEEVEKFDGVDASLQVREFLSDSRSLLEKMVRTVNIREEVLVQIDVVSDLSYAWGKALDDYNHVWHDRVRHDPSSVTLLRAVFLKLSSVLDVALVRVAQAGSADVDSVAEYWSRRLVAYVKQVLEVVPQSVCTILTSVGEALERLPDSSLPRFQVNELGVLAAGEARYDLAKLTHKIATFTGGILTMGKTVLGVVEVDPKKVLEEGLRDELRRRMLDLVSKVPDTMGAWRVHLGHKARDMTRLKRAFEYVQDYMTLDGPRTWNEELVRVVEVEHEYIGGVLAKQLQTVDWMNERMYLPILGDIFSLIGVVGCLRLEAIVTAESQAILSEVLKATRSCENSLNQLFLPQGVVWGSANWVESVREARRKYPSDVMESDLKRFAKLGATAVLRSKIRFYLARETRRDAPLLSSCVKNMPRGQMSDSDRSRVAAVGLAQSVSLSVRETFDEQSVARRVFIILNELTKRIVTDNVPDGVYGSAEYYNVCAGVATLMHIKRFAAELDRCVYASARAYCLKSLQERQVAETSFVFKFGAQKVAKIALDRLLVEQSIHRLVAVLANRPARSSKRAPVLVERVAEVWSGH